MGHDQSESAGLSDKEIQAEKEFLAGVPFFNLGALFMPPIWGIAHGEIAPILFYPLWVFVDNLIYSAVQTPSVLTISIAVIVTAVIVIVMFGYARLSSPKSAHRADERGISREQYLRTERRWAIAMGILALAMLILATWFNLTIRPTME